MKTQDSLLNMVKFLLNYRYFLIRHWPILDFEVFGEDGFPTVCVIPLDISPA